MILKYHSHNNMYDTIMKFYFLRNVVLNRVSNDVRYTICKNTYWIVQDMIWHNAYINLQS